MDPGCPLPQLLQEIRPKPQQRRFGGSLKEDKLYQEFKSKGNFEPSIKKSLGRFLRKHLLDAIQNDSRKRHLTQVVPMRSRKTPGLCFADISLAAPTLTQDKLFQYRRGLFMYNFQCRCDKTVVFHRGHEECPQLGGEVYLSRQEHSQKREMRRDLSLGASMFTSLDFLLNIGELQRVSATLVEVQRKLGQVFTEVQKQKQTTLVTVAPT
jgi:hypothetical protein